jgi:hypothetical protein
MIKPGTRDYSTFIGRLVIVFPDGEKLALTDYVQAKSIPMTFTLENYGLELVNTKGDKIILGMECQGENIEDNFKVKEEVKEPIAEKDLEEIPSAGSGS